MTYRVLTAESNTTDWLKLRKQGIGASEAAAVLGDTSWGTPLTVYLEKTSDLVDDLQNERMMWGHRMEPEIAKWSAIDFPESGEIIPSEGLLQSVEYPFLLATLDRNIIFPDGEVGPFEIKNVDGNEKYRWMDNGELVVPKPYWIQTHVQMAVTGAVRAAVQPFFGGNHLPSPIVIHRDDAFVEEYLYGRIGDFWNYNVIPRVPPEVSLGDDLWAIFPGKQGEPIDADDDVIDEVGKWRINRADRLAAEKAEKLAALEIVRFMGDATELIDPFTKQTIHTLRPRADGVRLHKATKAEL